MSGFSYCYVRSHGFVSTPSAAIKRLLVCVSQALEGFFLFNGVQERFVFLVFLFVFTVPSNSSYPFPFPLQLLLMLRQSLPSSHTVLSSDSYCSPSVTRDIHICAICASSRSASWYKLLTLINSAVCSVDLFVT